MLVWPKSAHTLPDLRRQPRQFPPRTTRQRSHGLPSEPGLGSTQDKGSVQDLVVSGGLNRAGCCLGDHTRSATPFPSPLALERCCGCSSLSTPWSWHG